MQREKLTTFLLHTVLPLTVGMAMYVCAETVGIPPVVQDHFADGLWAYSLMSFLLLVWGRGVPLLWIALVVCAAPSYEAAQYLQLVPGTGDWWDVVIYLLFFLLAFCSNRFIVHHHSTNKTT